MRSERGILRTLFNFLKDLLLVGPRGIPFAIRSVFLILAQSSYGKGFRSAEMSDAVWDDLRTQWEQLKRDAGLKAR
jgi:hypothetical protein